MNDRSSQTESAALREYAEALREMTQRYEQLVRGVAILTHIDSVDTLALRLQEMCQQLLDAVAQGLHAENSSLMLLDDEGQFLELWAASSAVDSQKSFVGPDFWKGKRFRVGEGVAGRVVATGSPMRIPDVHDEPEFQTIHQTPVEVRSLMCFPLLDGQKTFGVINLSHSAPGFFSLESERIASLVAGWSGRILADHIRRQTHRQSAEYCDFISIGQGDAVLIFDRDDTLINANPAAERLCRIPLRMLLSDGTLWGEGVVPENRSALRAHREAVVQSRHPDVISYAYRDGHDVLRQFEEHTSVLSDQTGAIQGYVCVIRDVTRQKRIEEECQKVQARLRHASKMEAVGELAGGVAHDFNNLLTGILGNISLARSLDSTADLHPLLDEAESAARRAAELTRQLLVFSRRSDVSKRPVDLATLLEEAANIVRSTVDRRIRVEVDLQDDLRQILADPSQIHQVILNLCVNARDALLQRADTPSDIPLRILLSAENVKIGERYCQTSPDAKPGDFVRLSIADTGVGMDQSTQQRVFEPFFTTKPHDEGTGLGLAIVYGIVSNHGGWIHLRSKPGEGTTIHVYLRAASEEPLPAAKSPKKKAEVRGGEETILVVDDEEMVRKLAEKILKRLGYTILLASDGKEGLETYRKERERVSAVVLDLSMPELPGDEVLKQIRTEDPEAKIILSSGHTLDGPSDLVGPFEPSNYLRKPYSYREMAEKLREVLDGTPEESTTDPPAPDE